GYQDRRLLRNGDAEPEAADAERLVLLVDLLARQGGPQEPDRVAHALVRLVERQTVPAFDDDVGGGADTEREVAGRGLAHRRDRRRERVRAPRVRGDDRGPEPQFGRPLGGDCEGDERVVPTGLGRPKVVVTEVDQLAHELALLQERNAVERERDAVARRDGHAPI